MNPILLDIPTSFETSRLHLRKPFPGDGEDILPLLIQQNPATTLEIAECEVRNSHIQFLRRESITFHVYLKDNNTLIGFISINPKNWDIPYIQISYFFDENYLNNEYELESILATKYYGEHILHSKRIEFQCNEQDTFNRAIIEQAGFELEGILNHFHIDNTTNEISHVCIYRAT